MNHVNDKNSSKNVNEVQNAFNNIRKFLRLLLFAELYIIILSVVQMIYENRDVLPQIAGVNTVLLILTMHHIRKNKEDKD